MTPVTLTGPYTRDIDNCRPPATFNGLPYTAALFQEAPDVDGNEPVEGTETTLETIPLDGTVVGLPLDTNPAEPVLRDLTTDLATLATGWYRIVWRKTSGSIDEGPWRFFADESFAPDLPAGVTLEDVKEYISITKNTEDDLLTKLLASVTLMIERYVGANFTPTPASDSSPPVTITVVVPPASGAVGFTGTLVTRPQCSSSGNVPLSVTIPHARAITDIKVNQDTTSLTLVPVGSSGPGYWIAPDSRFPGTPARKIVLTGVSEQVSSLQVTGRFGISPIPDDLIDAILTMTARRYKEREARWGDSVQLQDGAFVNYFRQYPLSVRATLDSYMELAA